MEQRVVDLLGFLDRHRIGLTRNLVPVWERLIEYRRKKQLNDHYSRKGWDVREGRRKEYRLGFKFIEAYRTWQEAK